MKHQKRYSLHCGHILGLTAILYIPIGIFASKGLAPLFASAIVFCLLQQIYKNRKFPNISGPIFYALLILVGWSLVSYLWSITPDETLKTGVTLSTTFLGGSILLSIGKSFGQQEKKVLQNGLLFGGFLGFTLIAIEFTTDAWLARFLYLNLALLKNPDVPSYSTFIFSVYGDSTPVMNSGMAATALFFFPWALALKERFPLKLFFPTIIVGAILIFFTYADAVKLSFAVGLIILLAAFYKPRWIPKVLGLVITIGILTAPLIPGLFPNPLVPNKNLEWFSPSSAHRILIWKNTVIHIKQKVLLGSGLDATRGLYSSKDRVQYNFPSSLSNKAAYQIMYEPIPLHPHNAVLQLWLELGAVGALIGLGILLTILRYIKHKILLRLDQALSFGMFTTTLSLACISFGIWQGWWLSSILLSTTYFISILRTPVEKNSSEIGGPKGLDPTRYGDWERKGRAIDF